MGKFGEGVPPLRPFTTAEALKKEVVLAMLRAEDALIYSPEGQAMYSAFGSGRLVSFDVEEAMARKILSRFGYATDDASLRRYRSINQLYYKSAKDHDVDVLRAVVYLRENKVLQFTLPKPDIGDALPDVALTSFPALAPVTLVSDCAGVCVCCVCLLCVCV